MNFLGHFLGLPSVLQDNQVLASQSPRWRQASADQAASMAAAAAAISSLNHAPLDPSFEKGAALLARLATDPSPLLTPQAAAAFGLPPAFPRRLLFATLLDTLCQSEGQLVFHRLLLDQSQQFRQAVALRGRHLTALSDQLSALSSVPNFPIHLAQLRLEHLATL